MRAPPLAINDLEPPDCFSYALNSVNLTIPPKGFIASQQALKCDYKKVANAAPRIYKLLKSKDHPEWYRLLAKVLQCSSVAEGSRNWQH